MSEPEIIVGHDAAIAYLVKDGNLSMPCSRYGRNSAECAEVAYKAAEYVASETGSDPVTTADLDYAMYCVVNDLEDIARLLEDLEVSF